MNPQMTTIRWLLALGVAAALIVLAATVANAQPPVPHPVERGGTSFEDCLGCHQAGMGDGPPVPGDHLPYDNDTCASCHGAPGFAPPSIPHPEDTEGTPFENCVLCHEDGVGGAPVMPDDHAGRDNEACAVCHSGSPLAAPAIPHPEEREGTPFEDCVFCHSPGLVNAPLLPGDHQEYTNADCSTCHAVGGLAPPSIPHMDERTCADCHRTGAYGAPLLPADHQALEEDCLVCHSTTGLAPPAVPSLVEGEQDCFVCHHDAPPESVPALEESKHDHSVYTGDTCLSCHRPSPETGIIAVSGEETEESAAEVHVGNLGFLAAEVEQDAGRDTLNDLVRRWAVVVTISGLAVVIFTLLRGT